MYQDQIQKLKITKCKYLAEQDQIRLLNNSNTKFNHKYPKETIAYILLENKEQLYSKIWIIFVEFVKMNFKQMILALK